nr:hypothetical protein [Sorangium cellulosum]
MLPPSISGMGGEAPPEATAIPLTAIVAPSTDAVGVTSIEAI